jgi:FlaA1/EpsC-like NDP-sugar epimerase
MAATFFLTVSRLSIKYVYYALKRHTSGRKPVMIYGAGDLGLTMYMAIQRNDNPSYHVAGFIDNNRSLQGKRKSGISIYSPEMAMKKIIPMHNIRELIIAISPDRINKYEYEDLLEYCLNNRIEIKKLPPVKEWLRGALTPQQLRPIEITDLLGRKEIRLDTDKIQNSLKDKVILITGAAGSIGSEIVRQLSDFKTGSLLLLDQAESALYDLQMELSSYNLSHLDFTTIVADVSNPVRMREIFRKYKPHMVFNAAAYKHVPLMEDHPGEAIRVNIGGTIIQADLSVEFGVEKFVMISTDKAVNPTNVMGATNRICEMYVQSLYKKQGIKTRFITTRFGNVLGSNGSVVPLFYRQIKRGGPITLTHRDVTRYFMTIPEACQLVLEAGIMGNGGEIFLFDMGKPVRIYDLAVKMITLAGLEPDIDIRIQETGLRPGEKLFEELLASKEKHQSTYHPQIMISSNGQPDNSNSLKKIIELIHAVEKENNQELVSRLIDLVPEYTPSNEKYTFPHNQVQI